MKSGSRLLTGRKLLGTLLAVLLLVGLLGVSALADNDAYPLLEKTGGLIMTGATGTNVNDAAVLLLS